LYFGIILSYIDLDFKLIYKLVGFNNLTESHIGLYICNLFIIIFNDYKYLDITSNNILSITRDNASNYNKFITILHQRKHQILDIRCIAHILNIVIHDILLDYLSNSIIIIDLSTYTENIDNNENYKDIIEDNYNIITKVQRLATLVKYTTENRELLIHNSEKYKKNKILPFNYNKTTEVAIKSPRLPLFGP
jgi:hypothetical protein